MEGRMSHAQHRRSTERCPQASGPSLLTYLECLSLTYLATVSPGTSSLGTSYLGTPSQAPSS